MENREYTQFELQEIALNLLDIGNYLTEFERKIINNILAYKGNYTQSQETSLLDIYDRHFNQLKGFYA